MGRAIRLHTLD